MRRLGHPLAIDTKKPVASTSISEADDVLFNGENLRISCDKLPQRGNSQFFFGGERDTSQNGPNVVFDESGGVNPSTSGWVHFYGWNGSAFTHGIHVLHEPNYVVDVTGANFASTGLSGSGDEIRVDDASSIVSVHGNMF